MAAAQRKRDDRAWIPEGIAAAPKEKTGMALIAMTKKTGRGLVMTTALLAAVALAVAPATAYAQHRGGGGGGGGWHGGGGGGGGWHGGGGGGWHGGGWGGGRGWGGGWRGGGWGWGWPVAAGLFAGAAIAS
jgi:hypothetical protein